MITCKCGGKLYRHGIVRSCGEPSGVRYICAVCRESFTAPITDDAIAGEVHLLPTGRRTLLDWRFGVAA